MSSWSCTACKLLWNFFISVVLFFISDLVTNAELLAADLRTGILGLRLLTH